MIVIYLLIESCQITHSLDGVAIALPVYLYFTDVAKHLSYKPGPLVKFLEDATLSQYRLKSKQISTEITVLVLLLLFVNPVELQSSFVLQLTALII